jgi:hypothetical protein
VVNSLVKANKHFQQQQEEYQTLLQQANDTIAQLKREAEQYPCLARVIITLPRRTTTKI